MDIKRLYRDVLQSLGGKNISLKFALRALTSLPPDRLYKLLRNQVFFGRIVTAINKQKRKKMFVPKSLIIEPTFKCNLDCPGCYAPKKNITMDPKLFSSIVKQAQEFGTYRFVLMGGEPTLKEVMDFVTPVIWRNKKAFFTICTNGTQIDFEMIKKFKPLKNVAFLLSIDGSKEFTDKRRYEGAYDKIVSTIKKLKKQNTLMALSLTTTADHWKEQFSEKLVKEISDAGIMMFFNHFIVDNKKAEQDKIDKKEFVTHLRHLVKKYPIYILEGQYGKVTTKGIVTRDKNQISIDPEGNVRLDRFWYEPTYGNLKNKNLKEILSDPVFLKAKQEDKINANNEYDDILNNLLTEKFKIVKNKCY